MMTACCCCWSAPPAAEERLVESPGQWNLLPLVTVSVDDVDQYLIVDWQMSVANLAALERRWGGRVCAVAWSIGGWDGVDYKCNVDESFTITDLVAWLRIACFNHLSGKLVPPQAVTIHVSR
jgi:hypothetical protein